MFHVGYHKGHRPSSNREPPVESATSITVQHEAVTSTTPCTRAIGLPGAPIPVCGRHRSRSYATRPASRTPRAALLRKPTLPTSSHSGAFPGLQRRLSRLVAASQPASCASPTMCRVRFSSSDCARLLRVGRTMRASRPIRRRTQRRCGRPCCMRVLASGRTTAACDSISRSHPTNRSSFRPRFPPSTAGAGKLLVRGSVGRPRSTRRSTRW